jgi:putative MATE family efflux protein
MRKAPVSSTLPPQVPLDQPVPFRQIYALAFPAAGSFILHTLYSINDFFWAGRIGPEAISALGLVMMVLIFNAGLMALAQKGTLSVVARLRGYGAGAALRRSALQGLLLSVGLGLLFGTAGWLLSPALLAAMGGEGETLRLGVQYLRLIYLGYPLMALAMTLDGIYIGIGDTRTPFRLSLLGVALNTALNATSVLLLDAGLTGIALASIGSRVLAGGLGAWLLARRFARVEALGGSPGRSHRPSKAEWRPSLGQWGEMLRVGLPAGLSVAFYSGIFMVLNRILAQFGQEAYGVIGIGIRGIESVGFMVLLGFGAAASTLAGSRLGQLAAAGALEAGNAALGPLRRTILRTALAALPVALLFSVLWLFMPEPLCRIYTDDPELIRLSSAYLRMAAFANLVQLLEMVLSEGLVGAGVAGWPLRITIPGNLLRIPLALALVAWTDWGLNAVWAAILVSAVVKGLGMAALFRWAPWPREALGGARRLGVIPRESQSPA